MREGAVVRSRDDVYELVDDIGDIGDRGFAGTVRVFGDVVGLRLSQLMPLRGYSGAVASWWTASDADGAAFELVIDDEGQAPRSPAT